jgi:hypothetical protein
MQLSIGIVLALLSSGIWQIALAAVTFAFTGISSATVFKQWRTAFSVSVASLMVFQCCAGVLATNMGFSGAWVALGIGLASLLIGHQVMLSNRVYATIGEKALSSEEAIFATRRSLWRILFFVTMVMACALLVLFLILAMDVGFLSLPLLLVMGLLVMISLYYLATRGTMIEDEEKPNI